MNLNNYIQNNTLAIIVKTNAPKTKIKEFDNKREALKVEIKAPPENNKANIEIIKLFTKLTKKEVKIISGLRSKKKLLRFN
ncbi:YggU family protein [Candidatus Woesearchaeota archaeon]|nr:YggU family protein [Candidatus Woesearchaeota archaeon]